jgi:tetratricopeptide (TPR) repeat protein
MVGSLGMVRSKITVTQTKGGTLPPANSNPPSPAAETAKIVPKVALSDAEKALQLPNIEKEEELMKLQSEIQVHYQHGNYKDALRSSLDFLKETLDHFGKEHPATASAYNNVGLMHKSTGDWAEARKHYHEALRIYGRVTGKDHASYAGALHNIAALNKVQVHMDDSLTGIQRLQFNEEAIDYFQDAWRIRQVELGDEHPLTVASRNYFASTLAAQVTQTTSTNRQSTFRTSKFTQQRWQAAETHLREALKTATENPRGAKVDNLEGINTLSAAAVAQNLAIFLKTRGTEIVDDEGTSKVVEAGAVAEAKQLYEQVLKVRTALLHYAHPDLIATKFSLAELLEVLGDEKGATDLREDIVKTFQVDKRDESDLDAVGDDDQGSKVNK